jgi:hypothetical protein
MMSWDTVVLALAAMTLLTIWWVIEGGDDES